MIRNIQITNYNGDSLLINMENPYETGFIVESIDGLGPAKADISTIAYSLTDGSRFGASRVTERNLVFKFQYVQTTDGLSIEEVRLMSYKYFAIKQKVTIIFETDSRTAYTEGWVESNEPDIFSEHESAQISIICPDPFFRSLGNATTVMSGTEGLFEFPMIEDEFEMSTIKDDAMCEINNIGDTDTGVIFTILVKDVFSSPTIYNVTTHESMLIDISKITSKLEGNAFKYGDEIIISTIRGNKYAYVKRGSQYYNVLSAIDKNSSWFQLAVGNNIFTYSCEIGLTNIDIGVTYPILYGGI